MLQINDDLQQARVNREQARVILLQIYKILMQKHSFLPLITSRRALPASMPRRKVINRFLFIDGTEFALWTSMTSGDWRNDF